MALDASALSDRQFRRKVFEELQNAGTIDGLKGTLRSRLVGVLQRRDPGVFQGSGPGPGQQSLWQRAANSLYVEYLQHQNYGYALSVFQPECGLTNQQVMDIILKEQTGGGDTQDAADTIAQTARDRWVGDLPIMDEVKADDITVMVIKV